MAKKIIILYVLMFFACSPSKYNFKHYLEVKGKDYLHVKGQVDVDLVPNGEFVFYDQFEKEYSKGKYSKGFKTGDWVYGLGSLDTVVVWQRSSLDSLEFSKIDKWELLKKEGYRAFFLSRKNDSIANEIVGIRTHPISSNGIKGFSEEFLDEVQDMNVLHKVLDYSQVCKEMHGDQEVFFYQFVGKTKRGESFLSFSFIAYSPDREKLIDVYYLSTNDQGELKFKIFNDFIMDIRLGGELLVGKKWGYIN